MEKRYKTYLEKARSIIRTLDNSKKSNPESESNYIHQITKLKAELNNKTKIIQRLETEHQKSRENRSDEERLLVNAWHRLTQNNQFKTVQNSVNGMSNFNNAMNNNSRNILMAGGSPSQYNNLNGGKGSGVQVTTPKREQLAGQSFLSKQRENANKRFTPKYPDAQVPSSNGQNNQNKSWLMGKWTYF